MQNSLFTILEKGLHFVQNYEFFKVVELREASSTKSDLGSINVEVRNVINRSYLKASPTGVPLIMYLAEVWVN